MPSEGSLGPLEIVCDAPAYSVVSVCATLDFKRPLDVRWDRKRKQVRCACGLDMPKMDRYQFTLSDHSAFFLDLGQCAKFLAIYWREA